MYVSEDKLSVLVDNSSVQNIDKSLFRKHDELDDLSGISLLQMAEMIILYDQIFLDNILLDMLYEVNNVVKILSGIIIPIDIGQKIRVNAAIQAISLAKKIPELSNFFWSTIGSNVHGFAVYDSDDVTTDDFDRNIIMEVAKKMREEDSELPIPREIENLIYWSSGGVMSRGLYYYYLSRFAGIPYAPFPIRVPLYKLLMDAELGKDVSSYDIYKNAGDYMIYIKQKSEEALKSIIRYVEAQGRSFRDSMEGDNPQTADHSIELFSIARMVLNKSKAKRIPIIDAAMEMRESAEAIAFRKWIKKYQTAISDGDYESVNKCRVEIANACKYWGSSEGVFGYNNRKIKIGSFISTELIIKDKLIKIPGYLDRNKHLLFLHDIWGYASM